MVFRERVFLLNFDLLVIDLILISDAIAQKHSLRFRIVEANWDNSFIIY